MFPSRRRIWAGTPLLALLALVLFAGAATASVGDRLPEFRDCVQVCESENCRTGHQTPIPLHRRLLLWDCPAECDHACQHIVTRQRLAASQPVVQFHGKWPFHRLLGAQEPASVLFSLANLWAHLSGLAKLRAAVPPRYPLRPFYVALARVGLVAWTASAVFHTRDFPATEQLDYFAAGASVLYGAYYAPVRVFRLDRPRWRAVVRAWTGVCVLLYVAHVAYLKGVRWDYGYNMAANVAVGAAQNVLWTWFSVRRYRQERRFWAAWPGLVVAWVMFAMSMELFDFPPWLGVIDAHSLWHLLTIGPTILWYNFLVMDATADMASTERLKA
ncbi:Mn2+ homeostasis protein Per1 [Cordyceps fumosorosea ARSEF 2679]|uniref:Post-GPI attachment to proteins factor 3 n=1 Tax=Cordyceps fumosorosea (strain ARSEF 2679) TaxID=1081104 RepID=A0A167XGQ6_CORFA|nr:Mn2+ homeostasis protein Per1 [Cordyceps fumosorosea ARSEF 2679]OAA64963.1 Mn2+ homeostasis protein Per1 [Cordyceps fumosorosea ARSEF 2679]